MTLNTDSADGTLDGVDINAAPVTITPVNKSIRVCSDGTNWFRTDTAIASADLEIRLKDTESDEAQEDFPAVTVINEWQWIEISVNTDCAANCNGVDGFELVVTSQAPTNLNDVVINIDQIALWIATSETAIGDIQVGGLIDFSTGLLTPAAAGAQTQAVEWTDFFINYQTGADAIVPITDLQLSYGTTLEALN